MKKASSLGLPATTLGGVRRRLANRPRISRSKA
jgi:hypothetical protein